MENNTNLPEANDVKVYSPGNTPPPMSEAPAEDDILPVGQRTVFLDDEEALPVESPQPAPKAQKAPNAQPRKIKAKRDIKKEEENNKTRVDLPKSKPTPSKPSYYEEPMYEESPLLEEDEPITKSVFSMLGKGTLYFLFVLGISVILAYYIITIGNDIFAFVKDDTSITVVIKKGDGIEEIAEKLHDKGAIKYPSIFKLYNSFKNSDSKRKQEFVPDSYTFETNLNYDELIAKFEKSAPVRGTVDITFPEGLSVDEIIDLFVKNGVGTREGFVEAVKSSLVYDMDYRFLVELQELEKAGFKDGRKYALEGYLYPDTYQFYTDSTEIDAIAKLLKTFNKRFEKEYYNRCEELGYSVDDIINIAAIVQKETTYNSEYPIVSSLYHNRLKNPREFPRLQCDSTYLYAFPERREHLTLDEMNKSSNPYSTYSHDGLPPSAICNPGLDAIIAALYPNSSDSSGTNYVYYYMVAGPDGYHYFAKTKSEHDQNVARAAAERGE